MTNSCMCVTWLIYVYVTWLIQARSWASDVAQYSDVAHACVWHTTRLCVRDMTHTGAFVSIRDSAVQRHDWFTCVTNDSFRCVRHNSYRRVRGHKRECSTVTWLIRVWDTRLICVCVIWLIQACSWASELAQYNDMTRSCACVTWLISVCMTWLIQAGSCACVTLLIYVSETWLIQARSWASDVAQYKADMRLRDAQLADLQQQLVCVCVYIYI